MSDITEDLPDEEVAPDKVEEEDDIDPFEDASEDEEDDSDDDEPDDIVT